MRRRSCFLGAGAGARKLLLSSFLMGATMFGRKEKKHSLYYLLPGMTRANRHKRKVFFWWAVAVGIVAAMIISAIIWMVNRGPHP
jgi:hypothetical protein